MVQQRIAWQERQTVPVDEVQDRARNLIGIDRSPLADALALIRSGQWIDGAILDVKPGAEPAYPIADLLTARSVPLLFTTGYGGTSLPARFTAAARCHKATTIRRTTQALGRLIHD
ncbi:response regulator [Sphingomonas endophytica]|uniref:response regulator n=1 Tax=Sphingomonas endophytica TaxID=869719 RepID=UPI00161D3CFC|nr:response regulator [Sphingomonas endophytica]